MPCLRRVPRRAPEPQPRVLALAITWPYDERHGWRIEARQPWDHYGPGVQALGYRIAEAPLVGFDPYNAVVYAAGVYYLAHLEPAPSERPFWSPRPDLGEILRWNLGLP
jgi:hypothetical protein